MVIIHRKRFQSKKELPTSFFSSTVIIYCLSPGSKRKKYTARR